MAKKRKYEPSLADEAVDSIIKDIEDRPELSLGWNNISKEKRHKIRLKWKMYINEKMDWIRNCF